MESTLEKLEQVLAGELDAHETMLVSASTFNSALRKEDVATIDRQRVIHDETISRIEKLEEQRIACCELLARSLGAATTPLSFSMLLEQVPPAWRRRFEVLRSALKDKIAEIARISTSNRILLEEGLRVADATVALLTGGSRGYGGYGKRGQVLQGPVVQSLFNRTV
jgi:hypothetical protein